MKYEGKERHCECCGLPFKKHGPAKYCTTCANNIKALASEDKINRRHKEAVHVKYLKTKSGLQVLNNVLGQTMVTTDKVWQSSRAV